jgi:ABC-type uncharacterized transport system substrate-binding protein
MVRTLLFTCLIILFSCSGRHESRILYINSYHEGYPSSDEIMEGIEEALASKPVDLKTEFMDSKRNPDSAYLRNRASEIYNLAKTFRPDLIILSDDNAVKHFGQVYGEKLESPLIFCGVNWSHENYYLPPDKYTGILEILPVKECIDLAMDHNPQIKRLGILSENSLSERKNMAILDTLTNMQNTYLLADNFDEWKASLIGLNDSCDLIFLPTNGAINNWDPDEAEKFVIQHIKLPIFTCDDFMIPYCVFGMTKIAKEQGEWAAKTALDVLNGKEISTIPVTQNSEFEYRLNPLLAEKTGFETDENIDFILYKNESH